MVMKNQPRGEFEESRGRGFADLWGVAENYVVRAGLVVPVFDGRPATRPVPVQALARTYLPLSRPELPAEFAKVATGDETALLGFVRCYGLLGYERAWRFPLEAVGAVRGRFYTPHLPGDPLAWVIAHARAVKLGGELARGLSAPEELARLIEGLTVRGALGRDEITFLRAVRGYTRPVQVQMAAARDHHETALRIVEMIVSPNLEGISRALITEHRRPGEKTKAMTSVFYPQNLLDCVYWLLADAIVGTAIRRCQHCGRFFVATHNRMRFCPRPMGQKGVSLCMNRFKQQRFRETQGKRLKTRRQRRGRRRHDA
jgi:hypothetical protein